MFKFSIKSLIVILYIYPTFYCLLLVLAVHLRVLACLFSIISLALVSCSLTACSAATFRFVIAILFSLCHSLLPTGFFKYTVTRGALISFALRHVNFRPMISFIIQLFVYRPYLRFDTQVSNCK